MGREYCINRKTNETNIEAYINLDGIGHSEISTGIGFFDHMLELLAFHSSIDIKIKCKGDLNVCDHHSIEDIGIALGKAFKEAISDKKGIERYGSFYVPMDESLAFVSIDISGRPFLVFDCDFKRTSINNFSTEMVEEFLRAFAFNAKITLHSKILYGKNDHHKIEAIFKALGRSLKIAKEITSEKLQSTKGTI
ncbi:imidazoleglycerol-phosphate dehydratase HisB [Clostridium sp. LY3-2]|uniref:imidazoleglycerol-phosphate dehydratase HisB n=1 Tax=Clostridium sp. LY3-2 TaxID=2942482 RepID=UPI002152A803|nr:imidazoleglycerol-phosphate dehydratase HisB [Clostridium sp. LY3-2]MCR6515669.1 imidazoleglycerol-phosphate dehydratase HisB [Clostridium sp. LY3-2]